MANETSNYPEFVFVACDIDDHEETIDLAVAMEAGSLVRTPLKYVRHDLCTRPAAPVEGLEVVAYRYRHVDYVNWTYSESKQPRPDIRNEELVTRSQAEAVIAAERAKVQYWQEQYTEMHSQFIDLAKSAEADNAALTARVKELEGDTAVADADRAASRTSLGLTTLRSEAIEAKLAAAKLALQPFATDADVYDGQSIDDYNKSFNDNLTVGDLRRARTAWKALP